MSYSNQKNNVNELIRLYLLSQGVTPAELAFLDGVTSNIQTQLNNKVVNWDTSVNVTTNGVLYFGVGGSAGSNATESARAWPTPRDVVLTRLSAIVGTNAKDGDTIIGLRDDGVTVASITALANTTYTSSTSALDSGALSVSIAANSFVDFILDTSASTDADTFAAAVIMAEVRVIS